MTAIVLPYPNSAATEMKKMVEARVGREREQLERLGITNPQLNSSETIHALRDNEVGGRTFVCTPFQG
jgi:hypothetical protein